jgi:preprotein translocase subunit SecE
MEQRVTFFKNRMLRKIFWPERDEVNRERRR